MDGLPINSPFYKSDEDRARDEVSVQAFMDMRPNLPIANIHPNAQKIRVLLESTLSLLSPEDTMAETFIREAIDLI